MNLTTTHPQPTEPRLAVQVITVPNDVAPETWTRDATDTDLWHGPHGVIVNTAALEERKRFYRFAQSG